MAKVFQIFVPDNTLVSRIISCETQVTELYVIDRADKKFFAEYASELNKPALYILVNRDRKQLYVGETDDSVKRLRNHEAKDFWTEAIVFHSTGDTLSTTEVKWLEAKTYETLNTLGYYDISENKQTPQYPPLKRHQIYTLEPIFEEAKNYTCAAGFDIFLRKKAEKQQMMQFSEPEPVATAPQSQVISCHLTRNADAHGLFNTSDQSLTVLKGSKVNPQHVNKISETSRKRREQQLAEYTEERNGERIVKQDVRFDTPSGAAVLCVGGSANGWLEWKDGEGRELNAYRNNDGTPQTQVLFDANRVRDPRQFQLDFWSRLRDKLQATGKIPTLQTPQPHNWYDVRIGRSNILLNLVCNTQKNFVGVKLYIRNQAVGIYYPALAAKKEAINKALGCEPEWDANPTAKDKTVVIFHNTNLTDSVKTEEALDWLVEQTLIFHRVFSKEVKGIPVPKKSYPFNMILLAR